MKKHAITLILLLALMLPACRIKDTQEARTATDSLSINKGRALDVFQILERYDTLGRILERQITQAREQDSLHLMHHAQAQHSKHMHSASAPSFTQPWFTSWRALLLLFALGLMLGAYAWHRLRRLFP